jgi:hypothetical protein
MTYSESKKKLDELRRANEAVFRMGISHLMDCGIRHLTEENIEDACKEIMQEDDANHLMTNEFKCNLVCIAGELAKIDHIHLLVYISREMYFGVDDNHISYQRALQMIRGCIGWITDGADEEDAYNDLVSGIGFDSEELEELGYGHLVPPYIPEDKIMIAVMDYDYDITDGYPEEYREQYAHETYEFDTPQEFIKKWYELDEGAWYWVFADGEEILSGAVDPNDIEVFEDYFDMVFEEE